MDSNEEKPFEDRDKNPEYGHDHGHPHGRGHRHEHCHGRVHWWKFPFIFALVILLKGGLTMLLWNLLIPDLFHGPPIDFLQAVGLIVLAKLIFGFKDFRHFGQHGPRHHFRGRWSGLSREEREKLRDHLRRS